MFDKVFQKFADSNISVQSGEIVEAVNEIKDLIHAQWVDSPSKDLDGREECYRQIKGIDTVMTKLISRWSK